MKKILCVILSLSIIFSTIISSANASNKNDDYDSVSAKHALMERAHAEHAQMPRSVIPLSQDEVNETMIKICCGLIENTEDLRSELEHEGVYILDAPVLNSMARVGTVDASYVRMSTPIVYYNEYTDTWGVAGGGYYVDMSWMDGMMVSLIGTGLRTKNIGGYDAYGVTFTNTKGTYTSIIKSQYAFISDGEGEEKVSNSINDGNGKNGYGFRFQDYGTNGSSVGEDGPIYLHNYVGKHFGTAVTFTSDFANYAGTATSYYVHTYDKAELSSVSLSTSSGLSFTVTVKESSFPAYSSQIRF